MKYRQYPKNFYEEGSNSRESVAVGTSSAGYNNNPKVSKSNLHKRRGVNNPLKPYETQRSLAMLRMIIDFKEEVMSNKDTE